MNKDSSESKRYHAAQQAVDDRTRVCNEMKESPLKVRTRQGPEENETKFITSPFLKEMERLYGTNLDQKCNSLLIPPNRATKLIRKLVKVVRFLK